MKAQLIQAIQIALRNENFSEALQAAERLAAAYPGDPDAYLCTGDVFREMNNWSKAIENYEKALTISPNNACAYFKLSEVYELKEDIPAALEKCQVACRLEPSNSTYLGQYGKLLYEKGRVTNNVNLKKEGKQLLEKALDAGETDKSMKEQLAIAYLEDSHSTWAPHPEHNDQWLATERGHLDHARAQLEKAKCLTDGSNVSINNVIHDLETRLAEVEKREYYGYNYLLKAPIITGALFLLFGATGFGIFLLLMAGLYYVSQRKPGYLFNRLVVKNNDREPFIIRRVRRVAEEIGSISIFGSFMDVIMFKLFSRLAFGFITYGMVILMLPYEIIKGFWVNYDLQNTVMAKATA